MAFQEYAGIKGGDGDNRGSARHKDHSSYTLQVKPSGTTAERYDTGALARLSAVSRWESQTARS